MELKMVSCVPVLGPCFTSLPFTLLRFFAGLLLPPAAHYYLRLFCAVLPFLGNGPWGALRLCRAVVVLRAWLVVLYGSFSPLVGGKTSSSCLVRCGAVRCRASARSNHCLPLDGHTRSNNKGFSPDLPVWWLRLSSSDTCQY